MDFAFEVTEQGEPWGTMQYNRGSVNTGYILAGMIVAKETGGSLSQALRYSAPVRAARAERHMGGHRRALTPATGSPAATFTKKTRTASGTLAGAGEPVDGCWDSTDWFPLSGANAAGEYHRDPARPDALDRQPLRRQGAGRCPPSRDGQQSEGGELPWRDRRSSGTANGHGILVSTIDGLEIKGHIGQLPGHTTCTGHHEASGVSATALPEFRGGRSRIVLSHRRPAFTPPSPPVSVLPARQIRDREGRQIILLSLRSEANGSCVRAVGRERLGAARPESLNTDRRGPITR